LAAVACAVDPHSAPHATATAHKSGENFRTARGMADLMRRPAPSDGRVAISADTARAVYRTFERDRIGLPRRL